MGSGQPLLAVLGQGSEVVPGLVECLLPRGDELGVGVSLPQEPLCQAVDVSHPSFVRLNILKEEEP